MQIWHNFHSQKWFHVKSMLKKVWDYVLYKLWPLQRPWKYQKKFCPIIDSQWNVFFPRIFELGLWPLKAINAMLTPYFVKWNVNNLMCIIFRSKSRFLSLNSFIFWPSKGQNSLGTLNISYKYLMNHFSFKMVQNKRFCLYFHHLVLGMFTV